MSQLYALLFRHPVGWLFFLSQAVLSACLIQQGRFDLVPTFDVLMELGCGFAFNLLLFALIDWTLDQTVPALRLAFQFVFISLLWLLSVFHAWTGSALDYSLLIFNLRELFQAEALRSIFASVPLWLYVAVFGLIFGLGTLHFRSRRFRLGPVSYGFNFSLPMIAIAGIAALFLTRASSASPIGFFTQSIAVAGARVSVLDRPTVSENVLSGKFSAREKLPSIFVVVVESFSERYFRAKDSAGREYTPFINELSRKSLTATNFYSNSIQTARSQFSMLCSVPPSYRRKEFTDYPGLHLNCLPKVLSKAGYQNWFFKAFHDVEFDNSREFPIHIGFDIARGMDRSFMEPGDEKHIWGWGIQDDFFFRKFLGYWKKSGAPTKPLFAMLTTVTNHMMFDHVPEDQRKMFANPTSVHEAYANTIYLTDQYLKTFHEALRKQPEFHDAILIITGDNGYPTGQHGLVHNEAGFFEEFFRTPLIIEWPGHLEGGTEVPKITSHLDLFPTVLDLLAIKETSHFYGSSILLPAEDRIVPMNQPYSGTFLIQRWKNWKYVKQLSSRKEFLFDLAEDPDERINALTSAKGQETLPRFRAGEPLFHHVQALTEANGHWPVSSR